MDEVKKAFRSFDLRFATAQSRRSQGDEALNEGKLPRLLVVDDEPVLAEFVAHAARDCGYDPMLTSDDREFRDRFLESRPDMACLDLGMPGMDGVELLRFLAEQEYRGPVLIISGFDRRVLETAFRLGEALGLRMVGPLEKPVPFEQIQSFLQELRPSLAL